MRQTTNILFQNVHALLHQHTFVCMRKLLLVPHPPSLPAPSYLAVLITHAPLPTTSPPQSSSSAPRYLPPPPSLQALDVTGCVNITPRTLRKLATHCPQLKLLRLGVQQVEEVRDGKEGAGVSVEVQQVER